MPDDNSPVILPVRLDHQLAQELDRAREKRNMSRNAFVIEALRAVLSAQPDLKFRIAELAMRELLIFVGAAQEGGVLDRKSARSLTAAIKSARRSMVIPIGDPQHQRLRPSLQSERDGLALAATEPLREFVTKFCALCPPPDLAEAQGKKDKLG